MKPAMKGFWMQLPEQPEFRVSGPMMADLINVLAGGLNCCGHDPCEAKEWHEAVSRILQTLPCGDIWLCPRCKGRKWFRSPEKTICCPACWGTGWNGEWLTAKFVTQDVLDNLKDRVDVKHMVQQVDGRYLRAHAPVPGGGMLVIVGAEIKPTTVDRELTKLKESATAGLVTVKEAGRLLGGGNVE